jgi:hypothetical protein
MSIRQDPYPNPDSQHWLKDYLKDLTEPDLCKHGKLLYQWLWYQNFFCIVNFGEKNADFIKIRIHMSIPG